MMRFGSREFTVRSDVDWWLIEGCQQVAAAAQQPAMEHSYHRLNPISKKPGTLVTSVGSVRVAR
jgi:hypothetical protein